MVPQADLSIYDRNGQLTGVVEIKNKLRTSREWAAKLREKLAEEQSWLVGSGFLAAIQNGRVAYEAAA